MNKKYYSISEVAEMLKIKMHNLRHMDELLGKKLTRIRGRRYYQTKDIELLKSILGSKILQQSTIIAENNDKIGNIISKLEGLKSRLEAI